MEIGILLPKLPIGQSHISMGDMDDVMKVVLSGGDVDTEWSKVRGEYEAYHIQQAIDEVNERAAEMGIK